MGMMWLMRIYAAWREERSRGIGTGGAGWVRIRRTGTRVRIRIRIRVGGGPAGRRISAAVVNAVITGHGGPPRSDTTFLNTSLLSLHSSRISNDLGQRRSSMRSRRVREESRSSTQPPLRIPVFRGCLRGLIENSRR